MFNSGKKTKQLKVFMMSRAVATIQCVACFVAFAPEFYAGNDDNAPVH